MDKKNAPGIGSVCYLCRYNLRSSGSRSSKRPLISDKEDYEYYDYDKGAAEH